MLMPPLPEIDGTLLRRDSDEYEQIRRRRTHACNAWRRSNSRPIAIAIVKSVQDIQACLQWAEKSTVKVSVRSGGHNWFGSSLQQDTLLLDMSSFDSIQIDPDTKTVTVGPYAMGTTVSQALAKHGLCFPIGHCPGVPMGGFLLGGGFGWCMDFYGLSAESILSATVVTSSGEVLEHVTHETHPDWMWLIRGAGVMFPGVVTSFRLQLYKLPSIVRSSVAFCRLEAYPSIVQFLRRGRAEGSISPKMETSLIFSRTPPSVVTALQEVSDDQTAPTKVCMLTMAFLADKEEEFDAHIKATLQNPQFPADALLVPFDPPQDTSFADMTEGARAAYPDGQQWMVRSYHLDTDAKDVDWDSLVASYDSQVPEGSFSHVLTVCCGRHEVSSESNNTDGAYGPVKCSGLMVYTLGVYEDDSGEETGVRLLTERTTAILEPHLLKYNVLENPLNKETFSKTFVGSVGSKLKNLRKELDPNEIFYDPSEAEA